MALETGPFLRKVAFLRSTADDLAERRGFAAGVRSVLEALDNKSSG